ncbi:MAG: formyl transferase [Deltaproteobacteria bacterium]|nr:formyl transferase [Deltaproteobacteria bacterium]
MDIRPFYNPEHNKGPMKVAAFMSGSGSNIRMLLKKEKELIQEKGKSPFHVVFIFSDRSDGKCQGEKIALENGLPYFSYDIRRFHSIRGISRTVSSPDGLEARRQFDSFARNLVEAFGVNLIALGGYMSVTTLERCVNVHPADLSILTHDNKRKYTGDHAVKDAILNGEKDLRASTLWTDQGVDTGPLLMVSAPVEVILPEPVGSLKNNRELLNRVVHEHQEKLKEKGDWIIFPRTIEMIAEGRFAFDHKNRVYVDGAHVPEGYRE